MSCFMVGWTGRSDVSEQVLVLQRVAALMLAGVFETAQVSFSHNLCDGVVERKGATVFANMGGQLFVANLDDWRGEPFEVTFFIPRGMSNVNLKDSLVVGQLREKNGTPVGYPIDPDMDVVLGGNLRVRGMASS